MRTEYKYTDTTVSFITYHFVFCPRYRRKIFNIHGVEDRFKQLTREICQQNDIEILAMECRQDHVHLFIGAYPQTSIPDIMNRIKGTTSRILRNEFEEFKKMPGLWTRSYYVSTESHLSDETIQWYVSTQKTKY